MNVPTKKEWGVIEDLDIKYSYEYFFGKSNSEMMNAFHINVIERTSNLRFMPKIPFQYYIIGFKEYIESSSFIDTEKADAVSCFIELVYERLQEDKSCFDVNTFENNILPTIKFISDKQEKFEADKDIYGDFKEKYKDIQQLWSNP